MFSEILINFLCTILIFNLLGIITLSALRIIFIKKPFKSNYFKLAAKEPFVSIHFAICNEPPSMVLATLKSFVDLNYSNFEVVIISNNTKNKNSWHPIREYAKTIANFKFFHYDDVNGFKAGALNIALTKMHKDTQYVFTVDSDYKLNKDALKVAVGTINKRDLDVIQFPQDYSNVCSNTSGLQINYKHYFQCYLSAMDNEKFGLPTGTLTLVNSHVFRNGFEWPTKTITEDAHFGVELLRDNFKIGYCDIVIGRGTMPTNIIDYVKQFKRWIFGNFQTLALSFGDKKFSLKNKFRLFTMLSAWINLLAIPLAISFISIPFLIGNTIHIKRVFFLIFVSLSIHIITQLYIFRITSKKSIKGTICAMLIHIGTLEIGSFHWLTYFFNSKKPFIRTNKFFTTDGLTFGFFITPICLIIASVICLTYSSKLIGFSLFFIATLGLLGKLQLVRELYHSKFNLLRFFSL